MGLLLVLGNILAGRELSLRDQPTTPGVSIAGVVSAVEKTNRVYLRDTAIDGNKTLARDVLVTLMADEGEETPAVSVGQRVEGTGRLFAPEEARNPGGVNRRIQALVDGYELSGYILPGWSVSGEAICSVRECFRRLREILLLHIEALFGDSAPLFQGVMLGDRRQMDDALVKAMRLTGTVHVLTVSGMHLSLIAMALRKLLRRLPIGRYGVFLLLAAALSVFTGLTGCAAGTVRALIMSLIREFAALIGRRYEPLTALSAAALLMALLNPIWPLDASYQFSFFVVLGIMLLAGGLSAAASKLPRALRKPAGVLALSACAQVAALPMQLLLYGYIPLLALPMNLLCSLLMPVLLLGGWCAAMLGALLPGVGGGAAGILSYAANAFEYISVFAASLDGSLLRLPAPYGFAAFLFAAWMLLLSNRIRWGAARRKATLLVALAMVMAYIPRFGPADGYIQLDVGQGDAALFRSGRHAVLIDTGASDRYNALRYLRHEGLMLDAVILSHADEDHAGALGILLESEVCVPAVYIAKGALDDETAQEVRDAFFLLDERGIPVHEVAVGDHIRELGMDIEVLSPGDALVGSNERSLLLHTQLQFVSFLLAGDLPIDAEPAFVPHCDVLKVAHHGSKYATSDAFIAQASPDLALISAGNGNPYGHPHQRVLDTLANAGCDVLRTDASGCITLRLENGHIFPHAYFGP